MIDACNECGGEWVHSHGCNGRFVQPAAAPTATLSVCAVDAEARRRADAACEAATNANRFAGDLSARLDALAERVSQVAKRMQPAGPSIPTYCFAPDEVQANAIQDLRAERDALKARVDRALAKVKSVNLHLATTGTAIANLGFAQLILEGRE